MVTEPISWVTALEMKYAVLKESLFIRNSATDDQTRLIAQETLRSLPPTEVYAWQRETTAAVWAATRTLPDASTLDPADLPSRACWWWFDEPLTIADPDNPNPIAALILTAATMRDKGDKLFLHVVVCRWIKRPRLVGPTWEFISEAGTVIGSMAHAAAGENVAAEDQPMIREMHEISRFIAAACAWLRQRIVITSDGHIERHARRRLEREHHEPVPSTVKVVQLRRAESTSKHANASEPIEWSCRWIVNGHWRNQQYAGGEHKLIYILPFVKGPADKPLRVPETTVYAVSR